MDTLAKKEQTLYKIIIDLERIVVALSGGTDSSYLLAACVDALGSDNVRAITVRSAFFPQEEDKLAQEIARWAKVEHTIIEMDDLADPAVAGNARDRCYHCKKARFSALMRIAAASESQVVHGENTDDRQEYRPGSRAAAELGVRAPLAEAGLSKSDIRALAKTLGVPNYARPSAACLATRFPYDTQLTQEGLYRVDAAENALREILGNVQLRVRDHYPVARLELEHETMLHVIRSSSRSQIITQLEKLGYRYVTLDLQGYHSGSFDVTQDNPS